MKILDRLFKKRVIVNCEGDPYLHRWFVFRSERVGIFIHKFVRSDEDRALHDHPWNFLVVPLWRGYVEHSERDNYADDVIWGREDFTVPCARRILPILGTRLRSATYKHRVELINGKPAWSLFFRFKKIRLWGFWPKEGFIVWNKWWQDNCGDDPRPSE